MDTVAISDPFLIGAEELAELLFRGTSLAFLSLLVLVLLALLLFLLLLCFKRSFSRDALRAFDVTDT